MFKARFSLLLSIFLSFCFFSSLVNQSAFAGSGEFHDECNSDSNCQSQYKCAPPYPGSSKQKQCILKESCVSTTYCNTTYFSSYVDSNNAVANFVCSGPVYSNVSDAFNGVQTSNSSNWEYGACIPDQSSPSDTCSDTQPCQAGFVCENSTCVPNGITKVLCNINLYFTNKLAVRFMQFSSIMLGLAFFLGKISWGMIMTIMLGSSLVIGAEQVVSKLAGFDSNSSFCNFKSYCSPENIQYAQSSVSTSADLGTEVTKIYNMSKILGNSDCENPLSCVSYSCVALSIKADGCEPAVNDISRFSNIIWAPESKDLNSVVGDYLAAYKCENAATFSSEYQPRQFCMESFYKADIIPAGTTVDKSVEKLKVKYFLCDLTCSNNDKFGGVDSAGNPTSTKTLSCQFVENKTDLTVYNAVNSCENLKDINYTSACSTY